VFLELEMLEACCVTTACVIIACLEYDRDLHTVLHSMMKSCMEMGEKPIPPKHAPTQYPSSELPSEPLFHLYPSTVQSQNPAHILFFFHNKRVFPPTDSAIHPFNPPPPPVNQRT
jgi:hypothetical protein